MKAPAQRAVETRRLYKFEHTFMVPGVAPAKVIKYRSHRWLQSVAAKVWAKHGRKNIRVPEVALSDEAEYSYCLGYTEIVLSVSGKARGGWKHNTLDVLLHELTHAIGYRNHDRNFVRKYVELLTEYAGYDAGELSVALGFWNIKH